MTPDQLSCVIHNFLLASLPASRSEGTSNLIMDNHPSSARPHSRIPNYVISANRQSSSASEERTRNAWIKANAEEESSSASEERTLNAWIKANEEEESSSASEERTHNAWIKLNDKEESSSASEERTLNAWIKANEEEESSSASEERTLNAWVKTNEEDLLKAIANDETAEMTPGTCPSTVVGYWATEDTDKDLRFILVSIFDHQK